MLAFKTLVAVALLVAAATAVEVVEIPAEELRSEPAAFEGFPAGVPKMTCSRNAKDKEFVNRCIRNNFQSLLPAIRNGGTFGLPNLDPYHIKDLALKVKTLPISFHVSFTNLSVYGMPDGIIRDARSDLTDDGVNMDIGVTFPKLTFKGIFEFTNGVFASWNFKGRGPFDVTFLNTRATWRLSGKKKEGDTHMTIERLAPLLPYTVGGMKFWAKGLVDGTPALDDVVVLMVNRLWSEVVDLGKPIINENIAEHLTALANDVFRSVPYDQLFPKNSEPMDGP
ncbi:uncharacterized protein LOC113207350 [Frankliniella occidentalis]|uniref:Uncharacterized protein LOC113207350 n=1 Tax=Frankliniella occidentalis TaxID=133901 RepID=A0A6J1SG33_FRAOC|nr:uncharacterized protein LOC113207350 [Frankliniella occidentalis]